MLKRILLNPDDMWSRVENGELLYAPITVVSDDTHSHIYLSGQTARLPSGELKARDMRSQIRQVCENIKRGARACWRNPRRRRDINHLRARSQGVLPGLRRAVQIFQEQPAGQHAHSNLVSERSRHPNRDQLRGDYRNGASAGQLGRNGLIRQRTPKSGAGWEHWEES